MSFFFMLLIIFLLLHIPPAGRLQSLKTARDKAAVAMAISFFVTGSMHFTTPDRFLVMMPPWLPWHRELIYVSGFFEILGAAGLLVPKTRRLAAYGLTALLVSVFPANVHVALSGQRVEGLPHESWYYWARLPFQFVFIAWALWCSKPRESQAGLAPRDALRSRQ